MLVLQNHSNSAFSKIFLIEHQRVEGGTSTLVTGFSFHAAFTSLPDAEEYGKKKENRQGSIAHSQDKDACQ